MNAATAEQRLHPVTVNAGTQATAEIGALA
jgi:hypothetical protein